MKGMKYMFVYLNELSTLTSDMRKSNKCIEQFYINFNNIKFDVIYDISHSPFELLIGAIGLNWGCVLKIENGFKTSMTDKDFYALCNLLNLRPGKGTFTSYFFLHYIASNCPKKCSKYMVSPDHLIPFRKNKIKKTDDQDKIYFLGWNNHLIDKRKAQNFDKTELFFGKKIADYCRKNNISSIWTATPNQNRQIKYPWD